MKNMAENSHKPNMPTTSRVVVIVPAYNEEGTVGRVVAETRAVFPGLEILVVDDGSMDGTAAEARSAGARVVELPFNLGIGGAVQTGYRYALECGYDVAVQLDADGQHDPADLPRLVGPVAAGEADLTVGSRFLAPNGYRAPVSRRAGMLLLSLAVSFLTGHRLYDTTSGYRAAGPRVIQMFAAHYPTDYPEPESIVAVRRRGLKVVEVPVGMRSRQAGFSSITPWRSVYYIVKVLLAVFVSALRGREEPGNDWQRPRIPFDSCR
jgi:hypothetical protein